MPSTMNSETVQTLSVVREIEIAAPLDVSFEAILEQLGPGGSVPGEDHFPMKFEPWPGGRWWRDLGDNAGHWWGTVQVIKPPKLIEICGPLFMSYPAQSHVQYRLTEQGGGTLLKLTHRAMGTISDEHREGVTTGWDHELEAIRRIAESRPGR